MSITAPVAAANVTITRNGRGQVTSATQGGFTRSFGYDSRYYLTSTIHPEVGTTTYGRDDAGNMTTKQVTAGPLGASGITTYDYDGRNRLRGVIYPNGSPSTVTNTYWATDKLKSSTNAVATRNYTYDNNQNLKTESMAIDGLTMAATYNYTGNDQLSSIVYPVLNRTMTFNPDVLGRARNISTPTGQMLGAGYWPNGQIADIAYAGGSRATYGQNAREWLNAVTVQTGDGVKRIASVLTHDVAGNLLSVTDSADASYNRTLTHDPINRLSTCSGPCGSGSATYDGAGNIQTHTLGGVTTNYIYDLKNRLSVTSLYATGPWAPTYSYDIYSNASPTATPYVYDNASNLKTAASRSYAYDATNKRVKTVSGAITTYEFRSAQGLLLAEWKKDPGHYDTLKEHLHLAGKEVGEQQTYFFGTDILPNLGWIFLQHDAAGSVISSTWSGGGLLFKENYQPYGSQINGTAQGYTQRAFAGQRQDAQDLIYMGARYYNPQVGRFLSIDPKEADPSDLHSLNRYAYANNNPYRYVDPDGREPHPIVDMLFPRGDIVRTVGEAWGANIAYAVGALQGNEALKNVAIEGMRENVSGRDAVQAAAMLLSGRSGAASKGEGVAPNFVVTPGGTAFPVPKGAQGPVPVINPAGSQTGVAFKGGSGGAVDTRVDTIRIMKPTPPRGGSPGYPNGYIKYENSRGQGVDPLTGQTLPNKESHFSVD
jgi:RHS repeat-associated protein